MLVNRALAGGSDAEMQREEGEKHPKISQWQSLEITGKSNEMFQEIVIKKTAKEKPK